MLRILHDTHVDFIRLRKIALAGILAFIVPALIWMAVSPLRESVEFTGGTLVEVQFRQPVDIARVRSAVAAAGVVDAEIQNFGSARDVMVRAQEERHVAAQAAGAATVATRIQRGLTQAFGADSYRLIRTEAVGPRVGAELRRNAAIAMLISFGATLLYLAWRFEWRLAVAAVVANIHDIIATFAFMKYMGIEISLFVVGGILTVIGYSLADKVVVFDRVRELLRERSKTPLYDTLNRAVNETLPRTVMTGTTVLACLLSLIFLGGDVLRPFAWVLFFGILVGTFSSIYVASPVLLWIEKRWPRPTAAQRSGAAPRQGASAPARPARREQAPVSR